MTKIVVPPNTTAIDVALNQSGSLTGFPAVLQQLPVGERIGFYSLPKVWEDVEDIGQTWTPDIQNRELDVTLPVYNEKAVEKAPFTTGISELSDVIDYGNATLSEIAALTYSLTYRVPGGTPETVTKRYAEREMVTLETPESLGITLPQGERFIAWEIDGLRTSQVLMGEDKEVNVVTGSLSKTLTYHIEVATPTTVEETYTVGEVVTLKHPQELGMVLPVDYFFNGWEINGNTVTEVTIEDDITVYAIVTLAFVEINGLLWTREHVVFEDKIHFNFDEAQTVAQTGGGRCPTAEEWNALVETGYTADNTDPENPKIWVGPDSSLKDASLRSICMRATGYFSTDHNPPQVVSTTGSFCWTSSSASVYEGYSMVGFAKWGDVFPQAQSRQYGLNVHVVKNIS